jgi:hypothetical protein
MNTKRRSLRYWLLFILMLTTVLAPAGPLQADDAPVRTILPTPTWAAVYFNNVSLKGAPVLIRNEPTLDLNWGLGSPPGVNNDFFSARFTRYIETEEGIYRFAATSDDGIRLFIDDVLVLDQWRQQSERTWLVDRQLDAGPHLIRVEYFEATGSARVALTWEKVTAVAPPPAPTATATPLPPLLPPPPSPTPLPPAPTPTPLPPPPPPPPAIVNWRGEYFNNRDLVGPPALVRDDPIINFNWGLGSPAPQISVDNFSARWTRWHDLPAGTYRFVVTTDDGARVWVNNALVIDQWREQSVRTFSSDLWLPGGPVPMRVEFFEATQGATIQFTFFRVDGGSGGGGGGGGGGGCGGGGAAETGSSATSLGTLVRSSSSLIGGASTIV